MKTNKTLKWLVALGLVAVIAGCDGSGSSKGGGSKDGSAAGLDMLDLTTVDQEELVMYVHSEITKFPTNTNELIALTDLIASNKTYKNSNMKNFRDYKEDGIDGACDFGGNKEVKSYVNDSYADTMNIEIQYNNCQFGERKDAIIDGYMKYFSQNSIVEIIYKNYTEHDYWGDIVSNYIDYRANINGGSGQVVATGEYSYEHEIEISYYQYEMSAKMDSGNSAMASYNINGYRTFLFVRDKYVKVEVSNMISDIYPKPSACRTSGLISLTGKNNSKVTIQYNADRSMDFTLNGKKEHWFNCLHKNP